MSTHSSTNNKPRFSAGLVTLIITLFWVLVFAFTMWHGIDGIKQHDHLITETK